MAFSQKNPKNQSETLNWLSNAIKEFGFSGYVFHDFHLSLSVSYLGLKICSFLRVQVHWTFSCLSSDTDFISCSSSSKCVNKGAWQEHPLLKDPFSLALLLKSLNLLIGVGWTTVLVHLCSDASLYSFVWHSTEEYILGCLFSFSLCIFLGWCFSQRDEYCFCCWMGVENKFFIRTSITFLSFSAPIS